MNTIPASELINTVLQDLGFEMNGYDYWKSYAVTDMENEWDEEVYVSNTKDGYKVWYPERENRNKTYKNEKSLINHIAYHHN